LAAGVPPLGTVHFAESRDDGAKLQEALEIERESGHGVFDFAGVSFKQASRSVVSFRM